MQYKAKQGVSQALSRQNYMATLSHLRKFATSLDKTSKLMQPRMLDTSQYGMLCSAETPEGSGVGLDKALAAGATITMGHDSRAIRELIPHIIREFEPVDVSDDTPITFVMVNGDIIGKSHNPSPLFHKLKYLKQLCVINPYTSISWKAVQGYISINTDSGRAVRLLRTVRNGVPTPIPKDVPKDSLSMDILLQSGVVEFLDSEEIDGELIAETVDDLYEGSLHNYIEIANGGLILGIQACQIPFSDRNQAPRNCYQSAMGKQAMGVYATNYMDRFDTSGHVLLYPQNPMAQTILDQMCNPHLQSGVNAMVCILTGGYNQEDSTMMSRPFAQRGGFRSMVVKSVKDTCRNNQLGEEQLGLPEIPENTIFDWSAIEESGLPRKNASLTEKSMVIGKYMPLKIPGQSKRTVKDYSVKLKGGWGDCKVDKCYRSVTADGYGLAKVRTRACIYAEVGDKFASRAAQKASLGVMMGGTIKQQGFAGCDAWQNTPGDSDGYVTVDGTPVDYLLNPNAIPSRMTIGQILEGISSKCGAIMGRRVDATPFNGTGVDDISKQLESLGFDPLGDTYIMCNKSGKRLTVKAFVTPTFTQRLKHLCARNKVRFRRIGPTRSCTTRQPVSGRDMGGLRVGEMETAAVTAHGSAAFLRERMCMMSDLYMTHACSGCGSISCIVNEKRGVYVCKRCAAEDKVTKVVPIDVRYGYKVFAQELHTMCLDVKVMPSKNQN